MTHRKRALRAFVAALLAGSIPFPAAGAQRSPHGVYLSYSDSAIGSLDAIVADLQASFTRAGWETLATYCAIGGSSVARWASWRAGHSPTKITEVYSVTSASAAGVRRVARQVWVTTGKFGCATAVASHDNDRNDDEGRSHIRETTSQPLC